jgi:hypothetical protein
MHRHARYKIKVLMHSQPSSLVRVMTTLCCVSLAALRSAESPLLGSGPRSGAADFKQHMKRQLHRSSALAPNARAHALKDSQSYWFGDKAVHSLAQAALALGVVPRLSWQ